MTKTPSRAEETAKAQADVINAAKMVSLVSGRKITDKEIKRCFKVVAESIEGQVVLDFIKTKSLSNVQFDRDHVDRTSSVYNLARLETWFLIESMIR